MKKIIFLIPFLLFIYSFTIIDTLPIPSNYKYYNFKKMTLDKIIIKKNLKQEKIKQLVKIKKSYKINFNLTGIVKSGNNMYAIIEGNPYKTGDKINGFIIKKIMINKIIVEPENDNKTKISILLENY